MWDWSTPLRTARCELRGLSPSDFDDHARLFRDPAVVRYLYNEPLSGEELDTHFQLRLWRGMPEEGKWATLAIVDATDQRFLGEASVTLASARHQRAEVGYVILPGARGRGFATEAVAAVVDVAFHTLGAHRVEARLDARNVASAGVATRLGMTAEARLRQNEFVKGEWTDEVIYGVLAHEWRPRAEWELPRVG